MTAARQPVPVITLPPDKVIDQQHVWRAQGGPSSNPGRAFLSDYSQRGTGIAPYLGGFRAGKVGGY